jgi:glycosyltransferase involved in cell wall biosynthesis
LIERKGVNYLIEAMGIVTEKHPDYRLILVGEGRDRNNFEKMVTRLGLEETIVFVGTQSQQMVSELMRESRLLVLPSIEEGQGVVLVEALASGTPCVGSRVGGIPDVITPDVGQLVEPRDVQGLAAAINRYIEDDVMWKNASQKARERVEREYDWFTLSEKMITVYHQVLNKEKR